MVNHMTETEGEGGIVCWCVACQFVTHFLYSESQRFKSPGCQSNFIIEPLSQAFNPQLVHGLPDPDFSKMSITLPKSACKIM